MSDAAQALATMPAGLILYGMVLEVMKFGSGAHTVHQHAMSLAETASGTGVRRREDGLPQSKNFAEQACTPSAHRIIRRLYLT